MVDNKIIISFIMPIYNNLIYSERAIRSILDQDSSCIELVVVDDGSNDGTAELLDCLAIEYSNMRVIHQENQWIYASINNGIREARGEYIYCVNSDDTIEDGAINYLIKKIGQYKYPDTIYTRIRSLYFDEEKKEVTEIKEFYKAIDRDIVFENKEKFRNNWFWLFKEHYLFHEKQLIKREIISKHPFRNDYSNADGFINIQIADDINNAVVLTDCVYNFYVYSNYDMNTCTRLQENEVEMHDELFSTFTGKFRDWGISVQEAEGLINRMRLKCISSIFAKLNDTSFMTIDQKVEYCFNQLMVLIIPIMNLDIYSEETTCRFFSGLRQLYEGGRSIESDTYYFAYEMLESILTGEKDVACIAKYENSVNNKLNKNRIGEIFVSAVELLSNKDRFISNFSSERVKVVEMSILEAVEKVRNGDLDLTFLISNSLIDANDLIDAILESDDRTQHTILCTGEENSRIISRIEGFTYLKLENGQVNNKIEYSIKRRRVYCCGVDSLEDLEKYVLANDIEYFIRII